MSIKKIVSVVLTIAIMLAFCVQIAFAQSYKSTLQTQQYSINRATVVTLGDSVTAFGGWQDIISSECGATVINSGTGGTGLSNGLAQFQIKKAISVKRLSTSCRIQ